MANRSTPSLVSYGAKARAFGEEAKNNAVQNFKHTVGSLKHLAGEKFDSPVVAREQQFNSAKLVKTTNKLVGIKANGFQYDTVQNLIGFLAHIREQIIKFTDNEDRIGRTTLTLSPYYGCIKREVILDACHIAGFKTVSLISEGLATGITYSVRNITEKTTETIFVVDIGHSQTSVSCINVGMNYVNVIGNEITYDFGGRVIDHLIAKHLVRAGKFDFPIHSKPYQRLLKEAEKYKKILSANNSVSVNIESVYEDRDINTTITREDLEKWIQPYFTKIVPLFKNILSSLTNENFNEIDKIELIGGTSRVPILKSLIKETIFENKYSLSTTLNQDEAISYGAAYASTIFTKGLEFNSFPLKDIIVNRLEFHWDKLAKDEPHSLIIDKPTSLPTEKIITLLRDEDFEIKLSTPDFKSYKIWKISGFKEFDSNVVRVQVLITVDGLIKINAFQIEPIEKSTGSKFMSKLFSSNSNQEEFKFKTLNKLVVELSNHHHVVSKKEYHHYVSTQHKLSQIDKEELLNKESKNNLESTIYKSRRIVENSVNDEEIQGKLYNYLEDLENWLYEDGEEAPTDVYKAKLAELQSTISQFTQ